MTISEFWRDVSERLAAGQRVFVSLVAAHTRGSPGTTGARLWVDNSGASHGTIGGGIMELRLIEHAREALAGGAMPPERRRQVHRAGAGDEASGLICAGEQTHVSTILEPGRDDPAIQRFVQALERPDDAALALSIDPRGLAIVERTPPSAERIVFADGPEWSYIEHNLNPRRLAIVGAGHCGQALAKLAADIGYAVTLFDTRPACLDGEWPAGIDAVCLDDFSQLATRLPHAEMTQVRVMTRAMTEDVIALAALAGQGCRSLGVMGASAKIRAIQRGLCDAGVSEPQRAAIQAPIGLPMKSDTPAEIAVSVMAELLADE
ncbi:XdhC family protein [Salinisphaera sp. SPP-AMP-43]|uniref:XdhC family protein n=1 Tax=Salinisphaera sp. SPP-AMP-43 TaxID=3121288 RepID=UPI003C6E8225